MVQNLWIFKMQSLEAQLMRNIFLLHIEIDLGSHSGVGSIVVVVEV